MTQHIHHIPASVEPDEEIMVVVGGEGIVYLKADEIHQYGHRKVTK